MQSLCEVARKINKGLASVAHYGRRLCAFTTSGNPCLQVIRERQRNVHLNLPRALCHLERAGVTEDELDCINAIHVSGTKGKGETRGRGRERERERERGRETERERKSAVFVDYGSFFVLMVRLHLRVRGVSPASPWSQDGLLLLPAPGVGHGEDQDRRGANITGEVVFTVSAILGRYKKLLMKCQRVAF